MENLKATQDILTTNADLTSCYSYKTLSMIKSTHQWSYAHRKSKPSSKT